MKITFSESTREMCTGKFEKGLSIFSLSFFSGEEPARKTVIPKGQYPLGITIAQGSSNGIFVTGVNEESIASKVGLKYGDQLLEVRMFFSHY